MTEQWTDIVGFEGLYKLSSQGRVLSLEKCMPHNGYCFPEKEMKLHVHTNKYQVVWLRKPGVHQKWYVHRLVAVHFLEKPEGKDYVNHKNKNRLDNSIDNLEWMTHKENCDHRDNYQPSDEPF